MRWSQIARGRFGDLGKVPSVCFLLALLLEVPREPSCKVSLSVVSVN